MWKIMIYINTKYILENIKKILLIYDLPIIIIFSYLSYWSTANHVVYTHTEDASHTHREDASDKKLFTTLIFLKIP